MSFDLYNRFALSKYARVEYYSYLDENAQLDFQNYLDLWSINPNHNLISQEDDQATNVKLNDLKDGYKIAQVQSFLSMGLLYYFGNGFKTNLPWYFRYPRHIVCISIGTIILPKYLIGSKFSNHFRSFQEKQIEYSQQIQSQKEEIQKIKQNLENPEYLLSVISNLSTEQSTSSENKRSKQLEEILKDQKSK